MAHGRDLVHSMRAGGFCLSKDFALDCFVVDFVCAVELRHADEMMVAIDDGFGGGGWVVHIFNFKAVEEFEDALGGVEVVVDWDL